LGRELRRKGPAETKKKGRDLKTPPAVGTRREEVKEGNWRFSRKEWVEEVLPVRCTYRSRRREKERRRVDKGWGARSRAMKGAIGNKGADTKKGGDN